MHLAWSSFHLSIFFFILLRNQSRVLADRKKQVKHRHFSLENIFHCPYKLKNSLKLVYAPYYSIRRYSEVALTTTLMELPGFSE